MKIFPCILVSLYFTLTIIQIFFPTSLQMCMKGEDIIAMSPFLSAMTFLPHGVPFLSTSWCSRVWIIHLSQMPVNFCYHPFPTLFHISPS